MGYVADWNRQNMKKTGSKGPTTKESRKDLGSLFHSSPAPKSKAKPVRLADGDTEETYKARGLQASANDKVGFFERLRMGNIDQEGSEAYNRFGAGRGKSIRSAARDPDDYNPVEAPKSVGEDSDNSGNRASVSSFRIDNNDYAPMPSASNSGNRESVSDFQIDQKDYRPISVTRRDPGASSSSSTGSASSSPAIAGPLNESTGQGRSDVGADPTNKGPIVPAPVITSNNQASGTRIGATSSGAGSSSASAVTRTGAGSSSASAGSSAAANSANGNRTGTNTRNAGPRRSATTTNAAPTNSRPGPTLRPTGQQTGRTLLEFHANQQLRDKIARGERLNVMEEARAKAFGLK